MSSLTSNPTTRVLQQAADIAPLYYTAGERFSYLFSLIQDNRNSRRGKALASFLDYRYNSAVWVSVVTNGPVFLSVAVIPPLLMQ